MKPRNAYPRYRAATEAHTEETLAAGAAPELRAPEGGTADAALGEGDLAGSPRPDGSRTELSGP